MQHFGRYDIIESLGAGGMGEVKLAHERGAAGGDRLVALKLVHRELSTNPHFIELLTHEAAIIARLEHENVVRIHRLGEQDGQFYIAMEFIRGASLRALMEAVGQVPIDIAVGAVVQACYGAHAAHELRDENDRPLGLVHRDITPHNLMVDERGVVKLLDFGVAYVRDDRHHEKSLVGKHPYMSPEQARGEALDRRSDVYALGTVLWELLAGRRRFTSDDPRANLAAIAEGRGPRLLEVRPGVPKQLVDALDRALAHDRDQRFATANKFAGALLDVAVELTLEIGERELAKLMKQHLSERMAKASSMVEQTAALTETASAETAHDFAVTQPTISMPLAPPLDIVLPVVATGANFELSASERLAVCRVWSRPDLSRDEGAKSAQKLERLVVELLETPGLQGFILDVRNARMVLGGKTMAALEKMFATAENYHVEMVALIAADPIQRLDFQDLITRAAPTRGHVTQDAREARMLTK